MRCTIESGEKIYMCYEKSQLHSFPPSMLSVFSGRKGLPNCPRDPDFVPLVKKKPEIPISRKLKFVLDCSKTEFNLAAGVKCTDAFRANPDASARK